ncbi:hypothetical protein GCM10009551_025320 [Nocardiopsis tropica]
MSPVVHLVTRHWGNTAYTPKQVLSIPLGYDRPVTPVGAVLPKAPDPELRSALDRCARVVVGFDGKLGDSLLAFGAVAAVTDALTLLGRTVPISSLARYGCLYPTTSTACSRGCSPRLIIGDDAGVRLARPTEDDHVLLCYPEQAHCRDDGQRAHTHLPARYYLGLEERIGLRLPGEPPFLPPLARSAAEPAGEALTIAAVTATSWPGRKDYGAERFTDAAQIIGERSGRHVRLLVVSGHDKSAPRPPTDAAGVQTESVPGAGLATLMDLFARCDVVLGNDTGLTHLAALVSARADVIGLYGRHSHSKWRTGLGHHHALATPFSERMHLRDMCPVRDGLDDTDNNGRAPLSAISPDLLADTALLALERSGA